MVLLDYEIKKKEFPLKIVFNLKNCNIIWISQLSVYWQSKCIFLFLERQQKNFRFEFFGWSYATKQWLLKVSRKIFLKIANVFLENNTNWFSDPSNPLFLMFFDVYSFCEIDCGDEITKKKNNILISI